MFGGRLMNEKEEFYKKRLRSQLNKLKTYSKGFFRALILGIKYGLKTLLYLFGVLGSAMILFRILAVKMRSKVNKAFDKDGGKTK